MLVDPQFSECVAEEVLKTELHVYVLTLALGSLNSLKTKCPSSDKSSYDDCPWFKSIFPPVHLCVSTRAWKEVSARNLGINLSANKQA